MRLENIDLSGRRRKCAASHPQESPRNAGLSSSSLRKNSSTEHEGEGHEFYSCREPRQINRGFQPLGDAGVQKHFFRKP